MIQLSDLHRDDQIIVRALMADQGKTEAEAIQKVVNARRVVHTAFQPIHEVTKTSNRGGL